MTSDVAVPPVPDGGACCWTITEGVEEFLYAGYPACEATPPEEAPQEPPTPPPTPPVVPPLLCC